jgi:RNA-binding protein
MTNTLTRNQQLFLKQRAHHLKPLVQVGQKGLTEAVVREIDLTLAHHELVKIRIGAQRDQRQHILEQVCTQLGATAVQSIGQTATLFRRNPQKNQPMAIPAT